MTDDMIYELAQSVRSDCGTSNPFEIAKELGIMVRLSSDFKTLCGMYTIIKGVRVVILNDNLSDLEQRAVMAHELGHDQLHREMAERGALQDFMLYDMSLRPEYEANMFAADLLLDDDRVLELGSVYGYTKEQIAAELGVDAELVEIKLKSMRGRRAEGNINET